MDVTDRRRTEADLREADKRRAVGQLAVGLAQEINNVLAAMKLRLHLLERNLTDASALPGIREVSDACAQIKALVRQMQGYAEERGGPVPLQLGDVVQKTEAPIQAVLGKAIRLELDLDDEGASVSGRTDQL